MMIDVLTKGTEMFSSKEAVFPDIVVIHLETYTTQQIHAEKFGESAVLDGVCDGHGIRRHNARMLCTGSTEYT